MKLPSFKKNNALFWLYIVVGILFVAVFVFLAPFWGNTDVPWKNWGMQIVNLVIALFLSLYLFGYLLRKIIRTKGQVLKILTIIEFTLLILVDLYLILGTFGLFPEIVGVGNDACAITGLALWIRGVVEIFRAYFHQKSASSDTYPIWWLCIAIAFVSVGMWMLVAPFISNLVILWIFVCLILVLGLLFIVYGCWSKPSKKK